jgi:hypothetical protein
MCVECSGTLEDLRTPFHEMTCLQKKETRILLQAYRINTICPELALCNIYFEKKRNH